MKEGIQLNWLMENLPTILVGVAVAALVVLVIVRMVKSGRSGKSSCGCGCADCPMAGKCHSKK